MLRGWSSTITPAVPGRCSGTRVSARVRWNSASCSRCWPAPLDRVVDIGLYEARVVRAGERVGQQLCQPAGPVGHARGHVEDLRWDIAAVDPQVAPGVAQVDWLPGGGVGDRLSGSGERHDQYGDVWYGGLGQAGVVRAVDPVLREAQVVTACQLF